ncbi:MAG: hypothetical protein ACRD3V_23645, partial [Vicinamibacteria bacterium]
MHLHAFDLFGRDWPDDAPPPLRRLAPPSHYNGLRGFWGGRLFRPGLLPLLGRRFLPYRIIRLVNRGGLVRFDLSAAHGSGKQCKSKDEAYQENAPGGHLLPPFLCRRSASVT